MKKSELKEIIRKELLESGSRKMKYDKLVKVKFLIDNALRELFLGDIEDEDLSNSLKDVKNRVTTLIDQLPPF